MTPDKSSEAESRSSERISLAAVRGERVRKEVLLASLALAQCMQRRRAVLIGSCQQLAKPAGASINSFTILRAARNSLTPSREGETCLTIADLCQMAL